MKKFILLFVLTLVLYGCENNNNSANYKGHTSDMISLSLYGVHLGDSINVVYEKFPKAYIVNLDSISYYLPLQKEFGELYNEMGASIIVADTIFIVDHRLKKEPYYGNNGGFADFKYDFSEHQAKASFFIIDGKVFQLELFVNTPRESDYGGFFPTHEWGETAIQMYNQKYGECDSILYSSEDGDFSITISKNASESEHEKAKKDAGYKYDHAYIWQWKNAQIIAQYNYNKFNFIGTRYYNFFNLLRVIYTDIDAIDRIAKKMQMENQAEENKEKEKHKEYQDSLSTVFEEQDL